MESKKELPTHPINFKAMAKQAVKMQEWIDNGGFKAGPLPEGIRLIKPKGLTKHNDGRTRPD